MESSVVADRYGSRLWEVTGAQQHVCPRMLPAWLRAPSGGARAAQFRGGVGSTWALEHARACGGHARAQRHATQPCLHASREGAFPCAYKSRKCT